MYRLPIANFGLWPEGVPGAEPKRDVPDYPSTKRQVTKKEEIHEHET